MSDSLFRHYESELFFIRKLAQEFARKYPAAAARLQLEPDRSTDPHVERLIESFALLTARVRNKIEDEFPELTEAMLSVVYPHVLAPIPSCAVVQFNIDPARGTPDGVKVPVGSPLNTDRIGDTSCRYRTCYPLSLWPIALAEAKLYPPPFPPGLNPPLRATAAIRLRLQTTGPLAFDALKIDRLRFHLVGENALVAPLYDLLFNHALEVAFVDPAKPKASIVLPAKDALLPVGFDADDAILPFPANVFPGYRLLTEYFAYPAKFLFVDVAGWDKVRAAFGPVKQIDVIVFLNRSHPRLEQLLEPNLLRMGCTPVVNLFEQTAEPIPLTHARPEYRVTPEVGQPAGFEVYSIEEVTGAGTDANDRDYRPFYQFRHGRDRESTKAFWYATRRPSLAAEDNGTDVHLHLVDGNFDPTSQEKETLVVRTLCTNRDLPSRLPRIGEEVRFEAAFAAPGTRVRCVRNPTGSLRAANPKGRYWQLISHLNLNHFSLTDDEEGLAALKGLLQLYDFTDPIAEPQAAALARQSIDGIVGIGSKRVTGWVGSGELGGFARGLEVRLELDETKFTASSGYLFASVLERFFGLAVSINSFSQLVARFRQQETDLKRWPPRSGDRPLL